MDEPIDGRYQIIKPVGTGGMAKVYLAQDKTSGQLVALKILHQHFLEDDQYVTRFMREAQMARLLDSPYIIKIYDSGMSKLGPYISMEYIEGKDLGRHIAEEGAQPLPYCLEILRCVSLALVAASSQGIVHRDIKSNNIMTTPEGIPKVLDFGIARARALPSMTTSAGFLGSPRYVSPEQARGERADVRSDLYSLGVVFFEMLTGHLPFNNTSPWVVIHQHLTVLPPKPSESRSDIPGVLDELCLRMLAKDPAARFQRPEEIVAFLGELSNRQMSVTGPQSSALLNKTPSKDQLLETLYKNASEAATAGRWQWTVYLLNQIQSLSPNYQDTTQFLEVALWKVETQKLCLRARHAMHYRNWSDALAVLRTVQQREPALPGLDRAITICQEKLRSTETLRTRLSTAPTTGMTGDLSESHKIGFDWLLPIQGSWKALLGKVKPGEGAEHA